MRQPVVSRTFHGFDLQALILDLDTRQQTERTFFIERMPNVKRERKKESSIRATIQGQSKEKAKFVTVLSTTPATKRFYLTEPEFIKLAHETKLLPGPAQNKESEE